MKHNAIDFLIHLIYIQSSSFNNSTVLSVDIFKISETPIKRGLLFSITQPSGEIDVSQLSKCK